MYDVAWRGMWICVRSKDAYKQLAQTSLRINFTCIFKVFQIALVASRLGQFCENVVNTPEINP